MGGRLLCSLRAERGRRSRFPGPSGTSVSSPEIPWPGPPFLEPLGTQECVGGVERPLPGHSLRSGRHPRPGCTSLLQPCTLRCSSLRHCCFRRARPQRAGADQRSPASSGIRVHSPPKTSACQHRAKEPRKSGPGSEAVMPTQLWVRAPVPGPRMVCHPVRGPGVGGSLPSAGRGARLESQERGRAGGPLGTEPCPELCQLTAVPSPLKTHTHMADPLPENPALNASAVSSAPRGWVRIRKGCKTRQLISLGPETQRPPRGWSQLGLSAPTPSPGHTEHRPGVPQTQAGGPHSGAREGIGQRSRGASA